ncbi:MAG: WG repeat-containing protein [Deltaproteobacteria bacterium]
MKRIFLIFFFILGGCSPNTPEDGSWTAFWNDDAGLMGFKDQNGKIRIEPRYTGFTTAKKFDSIVAVMEEKDGRTEIYYLTKSGKKVGRDHIYLFDNGPDCESEGFIRFRDKKTGLAGLLNGKGEMVVPAQYNDLTNVRSGRVIALKGARKKCPAGGMPADCDHFSWVGGMAYLIDTRNRIIIENFKPNANLDLSSLKTGDAPARDAKRQSFRGVDGRVYSFLDYEKEFRAWLDTAVQNPLSREKLIAISYKNIYFWKEPDGWTTEASRTFMNRNFKIIQNRLSELTKQNSDYFIASGGLNPFIYNGAEFDAYYNHCGEPKEWQYPVMDVVVNHKTKSDSYQDHFEFLRTDNGYRLISMTVRSGPLQ